ncbi:hypothetical protein [Marinobacter sp. M-5]|uniref:hypothetical protein n=1 Tax=Marinobacter sp. M-5 TaxID=3081089 RepID=UPI00293C84F3|nr:hypothetical protein [Marinobacter sp. M-5]MDV3504219.1 hypothetical protein [Marinobacter sp. M-5]
MMFPRLSLCVLALLLITSVAHGGFPPSWYMSAIEKADPNILGYVARFEEDACVITERDLKDAVASVIKRSEVEPRPGRRGEVHLSVSVRCLNVDPTSVFSLAIQFGSKDSDSTVLYVKDYGEIFAATDADTVLQTIKTSVEAAMTDYTLANFDR